MYHPKKKLKGKKKKEKTIEVVLTSLLRLQMGKVCHFPVVFPPKGSLKQYFFIIIKPFFVFVFEKADFKMNEGKKTWLISVRSKQQRAKMEVVEKFTCEGILVVAFF